ncbi:methanethiol oxidase [Methylohalobius crimeensis]|uniref:selenium-binding protein SBP56-related protein n=1 Tax=Methylohalobius crimeensis TaxID=244365 RepID=UPI000688781C|nr:selenium-binding protein SBP56-related protein [Methylohalobius crimeensis]
MILGCLMVALGNPSHGDETPLSPYMQKIVGQEDFVYVWTLGMEAVGDGSDKLVTIDVNPKSSHYGEVIHSLSVGGRHEAHHSGFTDDRKYLWAGGLDTSKIFIFDVHTDPAKPKLFKVIDDFVEKTGGVVGPHTTYALPDRMIISGLSNHQDYGGRTALVEYTNAGEYVATYWMPTDKNLRGAVKTGQYADGYGYDVRALPRLDIMLSSSFTGHKNYMRDFGSLVKDQEAMKQFGNTMVLWDLQKRQPKKIFDVPGASLEIRCAWDPNHNYCFTSTALTAKIWLIYLDEEENWQARAVADIGDPKQTLLPVDISIESDDRRLWVTTFMDGTARLFDISDPFHPKQIYQKKIGAQVNMVSQSWDGKRVYFSSSLLSQWDKKGKDNEQFVKAYQWDGQRLSPEFAIDFIEEKLGHPHQMRFGAYSLYR